MTDGRSRQGFELPLIGIGDLVAIQNQTGTISEGLPYEQYQVLMEDHNEQFDRRSTTNESLSLNLLRL